MTRLFKTLSFLLVGSAILGAQPSNLTRDEVSVIKKKLVAIVDALGQPPKGYVKEDEDLVFPQIFPKSVTPACIGRCMLRLK